MVTLGRISARKMGLSIITDSSDIAYGNAGRRLAFFLKNKLMNKSYYFISNLGEIYELRRNIK